MASLEVINMLTKLGIKSNELGFSCLYEMIIHSHTTNKKVTEEYYYVLAVKFKKSKYQIERALHYAFYQMEVKNDPLYSELFPDKNPSVFHLVELICEKIKED